MKVDLAQLFEYEGDDILPADHEAQIRAGLGALLSGAAMPQASAPPAQHPAPEPPPIPHAAAAQGAAIKLTTAIVLGLGMAAGGFAIGRATAPAPAPAPAPPAPAESRPHVASRSVPSQTATEPLLPPSAVIVDPPRPPDPVIAPPKWPSPPPTNSTAAFDREQSLLERARSALVRHDGAAAEEALDACEREFPRSRHAEERDYLRIQLLRERGDSAAARQRAKVFLAKYPDSLLRARVEPLAQ